MSIFYYFKRNCSRQQQKFEFFHFFFAFVGSFIKHLRKNFSTNSSFYIFKILCKSIDLEKFIRWVHYTFFPYLQRSSILFMQATKNIYLKESINTCFFFIFGPNHNLPSNCQIYINAHLSIFLPTQLL